MRLRQQFRAKAVLADRGAPVTLRIRPAATKAATWNPADIDLMRDAHDWAELSEAERGFLLRLVALGEAGAEAARLDCLPLIMGAMADAQGLEEELHLTSFLWDEAKHTAIFRRFLAEVAPGADAGRYRTDGQRRIVQVELPAALCRLATDDSPAAQAEASVAYSLIVVGVLTETGYRAFRTALERLDVLPGMQRAVAFLEEDTSRHLAYGVATLSRLVADHGQGVRDAIGRRAAALKGPAIGAVEAVFAGSDAAPFDLSVDDFAAGAGTRLSERIARIASTVS